MQKRLLGFVLAVSLVGAGAAQAQSVTPSASGTAQQSTTTPAMPPMPMMGMSVPNRPSGEPFTGAELAAIGVGVVAGVVVFQGAMWHGMVIMGAALGGWVGDYIYNSHATVKLDKTAG